VIINRAFFTKLHISGQKVVRHDLREPFDLLATVYRRRQASRTSAEPALVAGHNAERPTLADEDGALDELVSLADRLDLALGASGF
jgi:hypothetical protein